MLKFKLNTTNFVDTHPFDQGRLAYIQKTRNPFVKLSHSSISFEKGYFLEKSDHEDIKIKKL